MGRAAEIVPTSSSIRPDGGCPVAQVNDLSRSLTAFDPISTLVVVVEMSKASWLVSGVVPGVEPDAGNPPVRFDERDVETGPWWNHRSTAKRKGRQQICFT